MRPITLVVGHYGVGKTNFSVNLAIDLVAAGNRVTLVDLDIVNPYFRASEQRRLLESQGVELIAPVFAEAGTSLDVPSLTGKITPALELAKPGRYVIVDVGGDDAGSIAVGRYERTIARGDYAMLAVLNRFRNLVQEPSDAVDNLREIETACRLRASALVDNSHLKSATNVETIRSGVAYAQRVAAACALPLVAVTAPSLKDADVNDMRGDHPSAQNSPQGRSARTFAESLAAHLPGLEGSSIDTFVDDGVFYPVKMYVRTPWE